MVSTKENAVKRKLKELLDEYQVFHWPASAGGYGVGGVPDRLAVVKGRLWGLECKAPGKKATALQHAFGQKILRSGGYWTVVDGEEALAALRQKLEEEL